MFVVVFLKNVVIFVFREHKVMMGIPVQPGRLVPEEEQDLWVCPDLKASV